MALGGHAFMAEGKQGTIEEHERKADRIAELLLTLVDRNYRLVITHGNGPQVGTLLTQQERTRDELPPMPLDVLVAMTEGSLGYILQQALLNRLRNRDRPLRVVTMVTQVRVDADDPAFTEPGKPIGPVLDEEKARRCAEEWGWDVREDGGRGWRRVVPSPRPLEVLQNRMVQDTVASGHLVIAGGGGGIPVVQEADGRFTGVEGVVDKDLTSSVLAAHIGASLLVILTSVPAVYRGFDTPQQEALDAVTLDEIERLREEGEFPAGSMGPKVEGVIEFLRHGGARALITDPESLPRAIEGRSGTHVVGRI